MNFDIKSRYSGDPVSSLAVPLSEIPLARRNSGYAHWPCRTMAEVMADEEGQRAKWREQYNTERKKP